MEARSRLGTELDEVIDAALRDRLFPGIACGVWREGRPVYRRLSGYATLEPEPEAVGERTLFDMASLTKPLATALLVMKARDSGVLGLDDPLGRFLSGLPAATAELSLKSLLTHSSGLPAIPALERFFPDASDIDIIEARRRLMLIEPEAAPGSRVVYSCTGYMLLGLVLERLSGLGMARLFAEEIASPLGLEDACFAPTPGLKHRIAPTELCPWRGRRMRGEVHDESAFCLGGEAGNAGLFSSFDDAARIGLMYAAGGLVSDPAGGQRFLSRESWELMTRNQTPGLNEARGCGFMAHCAESQDGPDWPEASFGHTGFTGTSLFIEPGRGLMVVALANRVYFGREATAGKIIPFRKALHSAAIKAFG
jgi:CubicO group peptidase (beta-lactamase class C family)